MNNSNDEKEVNNGKVNGQNNQQNNQPNKQEQEQHNIDSNARVAQSATKGAATAVGAYFGGAAGAKIGSKVGDAINNSKAGQALTNTAGKVMNQVNKNTPMGSTVQKGINKASDSGAMDAVDKGIDMAADGASGAKGAGSANTAGATKASKAVGNNKAGGQNVSNNPSRRNSSGIKTKNSSGLSSNNSLSNGDEETQKDNTTDNKADNNKKSKDKVSDTQKNESNNRQEEEEQQSLKQKAKIVKNIMAVLSVILQVLILFLPIILVILLVVIVVALIASVFSNFFGFLNGDESRPCVHVPTCDQVVIGDDTYEIDDYVTGAVKNYFGEYEEEEVLRAMSLVVRTDLYYTSSINNDGACVLTNNSDYSEVDIIDSNDPDRSEEEKALDRKIINANRLASTETIVGYNYSTSVNESALDDVSLFADYKDIARSYLNVPDAYTEDSWRVSLACEVSSSVTAPTCATVSVTDGDYLGDYEFEDYVAGVVNHEVGGFQNLEVDKAFAVAARSYIVNAANIEDNVCYIANDGNLGFSPNDDALITQAVEETTGEFVTANGMVLATEFDAFCWNSKDEVNYYLAQKDQPIPITWANSNVPRWSSSSYLTNQCGTSGSGGHGRGMSQYGAYYMASVLNNDYKTILNFYYTGSISPVVSLTGQGYTLPIVSFSYITGETSGYCRSGSPHRGIDFAAPHGVEVYAAHDGVIIGVGHNCGNLHWSYGNGVKQTSSDGLTLIYGHLSSAIVSCGQTVAAGELIGYVGSTGNSTGNHLHFEMNSGSQVLNPREYIPLDAAGYGHCYGG